MQIRDYLEQYFQQKPTEQQRAVFGLLEEFLGRFDPRSLFILKGYAGTGKTTIISALVKALPRLQKKTVLLAPTGRAAKVISSYSGRTALTIHKKIYRKKSAASVAMDFTLADNPHENTLFIVDEASMLSDDPATVFQSSLLKDLITYVQSGERCVLLFVGDTAQLPPVGMLQSPALRPDYMASRYDLYVSHFELTDVVRQDKNSGILFNATKIRQEIKLEDETAEYPFPQFITRPYRDVFQMTGERLIDGLHYSYDKFGLENTMVICRSNKAANLYNQHIRNQILFRDEEITGGDLIMVVKNNYYWLQQHDESHTGFIANGDMAQIRKVSNVHEMHDLRFADVMIDFLDGNEHDTIQCRILLDSLYVDSPSLPQDQLQKLYESISADYADILDRNKRAEAIKKDPYFNALQIKFAYAITCHKAQGGQWPAVFIDQGYLNDEMLTTEFLRWLYTALTRATQELYLVNFHPNFFQPPS